MGNSVAGEPFYSLCPFFCTPFCRTLKRGDRFVLFMTFLVVHRAAFAPEQAASPVDQTRMLRLLCILLKVGGATSPLS